MPPKTLVESQHVGLCRSPRSFLRRRLWCSFFFSTASRRARKGDEFGFTQYSDSRSGRSRRWRIRIPTLVCHLAPSYRSPQVGAGSVFALLLGWSLKRAVYIYIYMYIYTLYIYIYIYIYTQKVPTSVFFHGIWPPSGARGMTFETFDDWERSNTAGCLVQNTPVMTDAMLLRLGQRTRVVFLNAASNPTRPH